MKLRLMLKSFDKDLIKNTSTELYKSCVQAKCQVSGVVALPVRTKKFCVLRSPHIDKDSREHFELRIHKHFIDITTDSQGILDQLLNLELPMGIACSLKILQEF